MTNNIEKPVFSTFEESYSPVPESFHRVGSKHNHDLYLGLDIDSRKTLMYISERKPLEIKSTATIEVKISIRKDQKHVLLFVLKNIEYEEIFVHFCEDIIESSRLVSPDKGMIFICKRYVKWQEMLQKKKPNLLEFSEIKGLVGELYFISEYLSRKYTISECVKSWIGTSGANQDFITQNEWYEIKTTISGSATINISSIEQLDVINNGKLVIVYMNETSHNDETKLTINNLVQQLMGQIKDELIREEFCEKLLKVGYYFNLEYDKYNFKVTTVECYNVDETFPCIRRGTLSSAVSSVKYQLLISHLDKYKGEI